jgi:class 3 adenylate cyclase
MPSETGSRTDQNDVAQPRESPAKGERRVVTVLFADVVNSTGLAERLDPEDWTDIMNEAFPCMTAPVQRYGGTVARLMGDGMLALFGAPTAHEDDPQRAVFAALDLIDAVRVFAIKAKADRGIDFAVRVGINTGPVVVAEVGSESAKEYTAMGDAVNVAARMEQTATPGTVQLSSETNHLVAAEIETTSLGPVELKGKSEPVVAYRVVARRPDEARTRGAARVGAELVGRTAQLSKLKQAVDQVKEGRGQIICLIGEAGSSQ